MSRFKEANLEEYLILDSFIVKRTITGSLFACCTVYVGEKNASNCFMSYTVEHSRQGVWMVVVRLALKLMSRFKEANLLEYFNLDSFIVKRTITCCFFACCMHWNCFMSYTVEHSRQGV